MALDPEYNVRIAFSRSRGIGDLIRKFTGGDVNHCLFIYFDPVFQTQMTLGANSNGLTPEPLRDFDDEIVRVYATVADPSLVVGLRRLVDWLNKPYDYAGLLGMVAVEAQEHLFNRIASNPTLNQHRLFCSEFGKMVCNASGYVDILANVPAGSVDPTMLDAACGASVHFKLVTL